MEFEFQIDLITHAIQKDYDRALWDMWTSLYPDMISGQMEFMSFDIFKGKLLTQKEKTTNITYEQIDKELAEIIQFDRNKNH